MRVVCVCVRAHLPAEVRKGIRVTDVWEIPDVVLGTENSGPLREQPDHWTVAPALVLTSLCGFISSSTS